MYFFLKIRGSRNRPYWQMKARSPTDLTEKLTYLPIQGGTFKLLMTLPKDYPFKPPVLNFQTKIYHPNVSNDDRGSMCLGIVRPDEWKPPNRIAAVLAMTRSLLIEPNPDDAVEAAVAEQYKRDREGFGKTAREWVKRYASDKV